MTDLPCLPNGDDILRPSYCEGLLRSRGPSNIVRRRFLPSCPVCRLLFCPTWKLRVFRSILWYRLRRGDPTARAGLQRHPLSVRGRRRWPRLHEASGSSFTWTCLLPIWTLCGLPILWLCEFPTVRPSSDAISLSRSWATDTRTTRCEGRRFPLVTSGCVLI